jgi:hypothetical protein
MPIVTVFVFAGALPIAIASPDAARRIAQRHGRGHRPDLDNREVSERVGPSIRHRDAILEPPERPLPDDVVVRHDIPVVADDEAGAGAAGCRSEPSL